MRITCSTCGMGFPGETYLGAQNESAWTRPKLKAHLIQRPVPQSIQPNSFKKPRNPGGGSCYALKVVQIGAWGRIPKLHPGRGHQQGLPRQGRRRFWVMRQESNSHITLARMYCFRKRCIGNFGAPSKPTWWGNRSRRKNRTPDAFPLASIVSKGSLVKMLGCCPPQAGTGVQGFLKVNKVVRIPLLF